MAETTGAKNLMKVSKHVFPYLFVGSVSFVTLWVYFTISLNSFDGVIAGGWGDVLGVQALLKTASETGLFQNTTHLNWPVGDGLWAHPQLGILIPTIGVFIQSFLGWGVGISLLFTVSIIGAVNGISSLFFMRSVNKNFNLVLSIALSFSLAIAPYTFMKFAHINVAGWYLIPILFGFILRWPTTKSRLIKSLLILLIIVIALFSPMWWLVVALLLLPFSLIPMIFHKKWKILLSGLICYLVVTASFLFQTFLYFRLKIPNEPPTRYPWDSNVYGGHLVDLMRASPWLNANFETLNSLSPGVSPESAPLGLIGLLLAIISCFVLILMPFISWQGKNNYLLLYSFTLVTLLFFLSGGLGNLQAGIAVIAGTESPARVWGRLSIFLSLFGATWALILWDKIRLKCGAPRVPEAMAFILAFSIVSLSIFEMSSVSPPVLSKVKNEPEFAATSFIDSTLTPCAIAQFPLDSSAVVRAWDGTEATFPYFYRPLMPYIILPEFYWSIGPYIPDAPAGITQTPEVIAESEFSTLHESGFCAILFDKQLSNYSLQTGLHLQGTSIQGDLKPDFISQRYDVYLLGK